MHSVIEIAAVVGIVAFVVVRQILGEPLRVKRVVLLPAVLTVVGAVDLAKDGRHVHPLDIVLIAASGVVAAIIGAAQGAVMRLEGRNGGLWGAMPLRSLWLWAALVGSRLVIGAVAAAGSAHVAASAASILLILGVNRLAQAGVIACRAARVGIPFTAEASSTGRRPAVVAGVRGASDTSVGRQVSRAMGDLRAHRGQTVQGRGRRRDSYGLIDGGQRQIHRGRDRRR